METIQETIGRHFWRQSEDDFGDKLGDKSGDNFQDKMAIIREDEN